MSQRDLKPNVKQARTCVYKCNYHLVFSTEYCRKVLTPEIERKFKSIVLEIAREKGFEVSVIKVKDQDHIHLFVSAHPKISPSYIAKMVKGISARKLFLEFPELKKGLKKGHLWNPTYYVETIGSISRDAVKQYIENQKRGGANGY